MQGRIKQKNLKRLARNEAARNARAEGRWKESKLFNIYTGKPAPEGVSLSKQYINFYTYVRRHVPHNKRTKTTYVNDKTGELADGITEEIHQRGQHTTLYNWLVRQKNKEFSKILAEGGDLPPLKTSRPAIDLINTAKQPPLLAGTTEQKQTLELSFLDSETPSTSPDKIPSAASSVSALILPPASHPLPTPLNTPSSSNSAGASDVSASRAADPSKQKPAQRNQKKLERNERVRKARAEGGDLPLPPLRNRNNQQKRQAYNKAQRRVRTEELSIKKKLYDIYTGKLAPEGASKSEQYIAFYAYVKRHIEATNLVKMTYVNAKTGVPAPGITKETHKRGLHTTLYTWLVGRKYAEFVSIIKKGGALPPALSRQKHKRQKAQAAYEQNTHPPASYPLTSPLDTPLSSSSADVFDASAHRNSSQTTSSTDQASLFPSPSLETSVDDMLSPKRVFAEEVDASMQASLTKSALTVQTVTATEEQPSLLSEDPAEEKAEEKTELDFDSFFLEAETPNPLPTTPLYPYSAEAVDAIIRPELDPVISAAQDSFAQDTSRKRKPNVHSFFQPKENDCIGHAGRKAKTTLSDGSVEHLLPEADTSDSISEVLFIPSLAAKKPAF